MRRRLAAACVAVLTLAGTAACSDSGSGVEGLTVSDDLGKEPKVEVDGLDVTSAESDVVVEGDGAKLGSDNAAEYKFIIAKGSDGSTIASNWQDPQPRTMVLDKEPDVISKALDGAQIGSRVALALPVKDLFGDQGVPQAGLTAGDDIVMVFDLLKETEPPLTEPKGKAVEPPADAPKIVEKGGTLDSLDFSDAPSKPPTKFQVIPLVKGEGAAVKEGDQITVNYFGTVWGNGDKPFDSSFASGGPAQFQLTKGGLIDGWAKGLVGQKLGSRVMLIVPPDLGYGPQGQPPDIPGNSTLVFVIDVLEAGA